MRYFINVHFDCINAPAWLHTTQSVRPKRYRVVGTRYGDYVIQFRSASAALETIKAYNHFLICEGYRCTGDMLGACYAFHGNYAPTRAAILADITRAGFMSYHRTE